MLKFEKQKLQKENTVDNNFAYCFVLVRNVTTQEGHIQRVSKNVLVRKLSGPNSGDVTEGW
jgi:hypothetical protein